MNALPAPHEIHDRLLLHGCHPDVAVGHHHEPVERVQVIWREEGQVLFADARLVSLQRRHVESAVLAVDDRLLLSGWQARMAVRAGCTHAGVGEEQDPLSCAGRGTLLSLGGQRCTGDHEKDERGPLERLDGISHAHGSCQGTTLGSILQEGRSRRGRAGCGSGGATLARFP